MPARISKLRDLGVYQAAIGGQTVRYTLKRSSRARYVRLEIKAAVGLTVVVPHSYKLADLPGILASKARWILGKLAESSRAANRPSPARIEPGINVPFLDKQLTLALDSAGASGRTVELLEDTLKVWSGGPASDVTSLLEKWYRKEAARYLGQRAHELSQHMGLEYKRITIRGQKTIWASCSSRGTLSLNWRLMLLPGRVVDYVLVHELAHLREPNHSRRFWHIVAEYCPEWLRHRRWLRDHERDIYAMISS